VDLTPAIPITTLLAWRDAETERWRRWFREHEAALLVPAGEGRMATVHGVIVHIFTVDLRYAQRLTDARVSDWSEVDPRTLDETFAVGDAARLMVDRFLQSADDTALDVALTFQTLSAGPITATKRKMLFNLVPHAMRHWAQVAMLLRAAGYRDQWPHDFLLSEAME
jgi:uncharacterized damage-inducible protein DinB